MKTADREAMGKLYVESLDRSQEYDMENPYTDDMAKLKHRQVATDVESGRIQPVQKRKSFHDDPQSMADDQDYNKLKAQEESWLRTLKAAQHMAYRGSREDRLHFKQLVQDCLKWLHDNDMDGTDVHDFLYPPYDPSNDPNSEYGGF